MNCTTIGCLNRYYAKGYCQKHYDNLKRRGSPDKDPVNAKDLPCIVEGCDQLRKCKGLCSTHYMAARRKDSPELRAKGVAWTASWKAQNPEAHAAQQSRYKTKHAPELKAYLSQWKKDNKKTYNAYLATRKARVRQATPPWADLGAIRTFYYNCPEGHHVDHVLPLNGKSISGLHTLENLQYLLAADNLKKSNKAT